VANGDLITETFQRSPRAAGHSQRTRHELRKAPEEADLLNGRDGPTGRELDDDKTRPSAAADHREITHRHTLFPNVDTVPPSERSRAFDAALYVTRVRSSKPGQLA
jgi:hypothetical protein